MTHIVYSDIIKFISDKLDIDYSSINMDTSLNYDLGIDGDDAIEFFEKLQEEFQINLTNFIKNDYDKYFGYEGFNPFELLITLFKRSKKPERFTIQMLIEVLEKRKKWTNTFLGSLRAITKVNEQLKFFKPLGRWTPWNQCQSFAKDVSNNARNPEFFQQDNHVTIPNF